MFQAFWGGGEEAQVVFRQHERDHLNPSDCFHLLLVLDRPCRLYREEKENHLLGRVATRRSSSVLHCATSWFELECGRGGKGGKVPPLLDHHHLHLHLHLLHNHLHRIKCRLYTGWRKHVSHWLDLNSYKSNSMMYLFNWYVFVNFHLKHVLAYNSTNVCKQNKETGSFNFIHNFIIKPRIVGPRVPGV